jgi:hypothetical protein
MYASYSSNTELIAWKFLGHLCSYLSLRLQPCNTFLLSQTYNAGKHTIYVLFTLKNSFQKHFT